jgi:PAS domain S-box-containing protein
MTDRGRLRNYSSELLHLSIVSLVFLALFSGAIYTFFNSNTTITRIVPTLATVLEAKYEITQSRLILEEVFRGEETVLLQSAWQHLEAVDNHAHALLQSGGEQTAIFEPIKDEQFCDKVELLHARMILFRSVTEKCLNSGESILGPRYYSEFEQSYQDCIAAAVELEERAKEILAERLRHFRMCQSILIFAMLITGLLAGVFVHRLDRRHRLSFLELSRLKEESESEGASRQSASDSLYESENRQRALLDAISDTVVVLDGQRSINYYRAEVNTEAYGAPLNIGKNISEVLPQDVVEMMMKSLQQALQTGEVQKDEFQLRCDPEEKEVRYFQSRMSQIGGQEQVLLLIRDVTMHKWQFTEL